MTAPGQHRLFLVPGRVDRSAVQVHCRWVERHPDVFVGTPHLAAYVQNRPLPEDWVRIGSMVCSETWFADRASERAGFDSAHYREIVTPDEGEFLAREDAWGARVTAAEPWPRPTPRYRVLGFGASILSQDEQLVSVDRQVPVAGGGHVIRSWWTDDRDDALRRARTADGLAIACEPWSWSGDSTVK